MQLRERAAWQRELEAERASAAQRTEALQRAQEHIDGLEERLFDLEGKVGGRGVAAMEARVEEMIVKVRNPDSKFRQPQGRFRHIQAKCFSLSLGDFGQREEERRAALADKPRRDCDAHRVQGLEAMAALDYDGAVHHFRVGVRSNRRHCWRLVHDHM